MGIFVSVPKTIECVAIALAFAAALCLSAKKPAGVLQSCGYANKKFAKWLKKKGNMTYGRLALLATLCLFSSAVVGACFAFCGEWAAIVSLAPFVIFFVVYIWADKKVALRSELTLTPRFKRLYVVLFLVCAVVSYILVTLLNFVDYIWEEAVFTYLRYCALALLPVLLIPMLMLANSIAKVYEVPHNKKFVRRAKAKLAASDLKVVAITGSYGKTSTKYILSAILSAKYRVLSTPRSHNTPMGIALALNNNKLEDYDLFIAEMGARHVGDIAELCEICPPDVSVITGICPQHLETFGTVADIVKAKGEILRYTRGAAIIADDCFDLFGAFGCEKLRCDCVSEIESTCEGTQFTLTLGGESRRVGCRLLGRHSAQNIGLAAQAAYLAGMTLDEIAAAVGGLDYIEHRLQLIKVNGVNILDDGYNSNVKGARAALNVLKSFGGRKIVVTPGLVELGVLEEAENAALGRELVGFDLVILVGETLVASVRRGYTESGGDGEKLRQCPSLKAAQELLKSVIAQGDTVLFLNDLPDVY